MLSKSEVQWNHNTIYTNLWNDNTKVNIEESDGISFKVDLRINKDLYSGDDLRDILNITFYHRSRFYNERGFSDAEMKPLKFDF